MTSEMEITSFFQSYAQAGSGLHIVKASGIGWIPEAQTVEKSAQPKDSEGGDV